MTRARDVSRLITTPPSIYQTDTESSSAGYLSQSSASSTYQTISGNNNSYRNKIINGDFNIWQRGTSFTESTLGTNSAGAYSADRWQTHRVADPIQVTRQASGLTGFQYCIRVQKTSGNSKSTGAIISQTIETSNSIPMAGQTFTFSFYARAGANFSATSNALIANIITGTGTDQGGYDTSIPGTGSFTGLRTALSQTFNITTSWVRYSATGTFNADTNEIAVRIYYTPTGTAGANDYFEVTGIQLEIGSVATPYESISIADELSQCQRYFWRGFVSGGGVWGGSGGTVPLISCSYPVKMRAAPIWAWISGGIASNGNVGYTITGTVTSALQADSALLGFSISGSTGANTQGCAVYDSLNSFSAEL